VEINLHSSVGHFHGRGGINLRTSMEMYQHARPKPIPNIIPGQIRTLQIVCNLQFVAGIKYLYNTSIMKVVLVATSASDLQGHATGLWIEELAAPYYKFKEADYEVVVASPAGGAIPIDAGSMGEGFFTDDAKTFMHDAEAVGQLGHSTKLESIDFSTGVDAIFLCGGHGTCVDFHDNAVLKSAIETLYAADKVVSAVCHGPIGLPQCNKPDGTPLVKDKVVTGFKDSEEMAVQKQALVPFMLETKLKEIGGKYESADDWNSKVCVDGNLVTGQNPQSSEACAAAVITVLSS